MESLHKILELVDKNSSSIPEGDYLQLCNLMKTIHVTLKEKPVEARPAPVPFRPFEPLVFVPERTEVLDFAFSQGIQQRMYNLGMEKSAIRIRRNITERVKHMAITERMVFMGLTPTSIDTNIERLRQKNIIVGCEKSFYKNFVLRQNCKKEERIREIDRELACLRASMIRIII